MSDFKFEFERPRAEGITEERILDELERVARHFDYCHFRRKDFNGLAEIHSATVERHFSGSWSAAMRALKERLGQKGIILELTDQRNIPEKAMFDEMERIWVQLGHRPSRDEWRGATPSISYDSIYRRFGGWTNACLRFIEYKSGGAVIGESEQDMEVGGQSKMSRSNRERIIETREPRKSLQKTRSVPLNLRYKVLNRDNFCCVSCGKSPATHIDTRLHVDHIIPFSEGGANSLANLQTLCEQCNLGKSNVVL